MVLNGIIEEIVYKDDGENIVPVKVFSRSTLGSKFKSDDVISINRPSFNENIKYFSLTRKIVISFL